VSELNFEDLVKINTIKDTYEKQKEDMVNQQMDVLENVRNTEQKKYEDKLEKEKEAKNKVVREIKIKEDLLKKEKEEREQKERELSNKINEKEN
jgi:hypothetical protein